MKASGFDAIWFGSFLVLAVEMAPITPPVSFNLFVIKGRTDDGPGYIARDVGETGANYFANRPSSGNPVIAWGRNAGL